MDCFCMEEAMTMGLSRIWVFAAIAGLAGGVFAATVDIEWVIVADHRNPNDDTGFGSVASIYEIGKYEVTAAQYTAFLNAVAAADPHGLYAADMWLSPYPCGIQRHGTPGAYSYTVEPDYANRPVRHVSFWDACRFANWLNNDGGSTETGAYTLNNITNPDNASVVRRSTAKVFLPTLNEWYKAAYYDGQAKRYYDYATGTDVMPSLLLVDPDPGNNANYSMGLRQNSVGPPYWASEVGAFENSASPYGTHDQSGNVWEWTEGLSGNRNRVACGGAFGLGPEKLLFANRLELDAKDWLPNVGFRVARVSTAACGDPQHPYPTGDLNRDCYVNFDDMAILIAAWLNCTDPGPPCNYRP